MTERGNTAYADVDDLPALVAKAVAAAKQQGFDNSCAPEQGRLLAVLAKGWSGGRIGETGTGCGVGLAWMIDATDEGTEFVSIERDEHRATTTRQFFADNPAVEILHGDWTELREHGPFDLLVLDGGGKGKDPGGGAPLDPADGWLNVGGTVVLDDFVPAGAPGADKHDAARRHWLEHPLLHATELRLTAELATIIGVRTR